MGKLTVLIVDDEEITRLQIKKALEDENFHILLASNGLEGIDILTKHYIDIVVSDHVMPEMTGIEFLENVKRKYPSILTIMITAHADTELAIEAINKAGVYKFIRKPLNYHEFKLALRRSVEALQVVKERDALLHQVRQYELTLQDLEKKYPGITKVDRDEDGAVLSID